MKIDEMNLENHVGEVVYFCHEERIDGRGDQYDEYFSTPDEALEYRDYIIAHMSDRDDWSVTACCGIVSEAGFVGEWNEFERETAECVHDEHIAAGDSLYINGEEYIAPEEEGTYRLMEEYTIGTNTHVAFRWEKEDD